ncbi:MAG TPA: hypothetical protein VIE40_05690 [Dehalococcoidia bacterium]|jgi:hypothetical protein
MTHFRFEQKIVALVTVAAICSAAMLWAAVSSADAQTPPEAPDLVVHLYQDEPIPLTETAFGADTQTRALDARCRVYVYKDLEGTQVPDDVNADLDTDPKLPTLAKATPDADGIVTFNLPQGTYSVSQLGCFTSVGGYGERACCTNLVGDPGVKVISTKSGAFGLFVQDVVVMPGQTKTIVTHATYDSVTSRGRTLIYVLILFAILLMIGVAGGLWKFRASYDPRSDPDHPLMGPAPDPNRKRAGFDEAFRDFLKRH